MKKKLLIVFALALLLTGCKNKLSVKEGDLVTFKNKELNISTTDLYNSLKEKYGTSILIDMMDKKILDKEYPDSDEIAKYVDVQVDSIKNYYKTEQEFLEYINQYGYKNVDELKEYFKLSKKRSLAVDDYVANLISDDEIKNFYDSKVSGDVTGSHILIEVNVDSSKSDEEKKTAKEEALKKAQEAIDKLKEGKDFAEIAKEYSNDEATKDDGGSMGTFNTLDSDDVTRQEFTKLEKGKYSETPVETEYGYEIFLKVDEKEKPKLESVKKKIIDKLANERITTDSKLQYKGLMAIREKYGFEIKDDDLKTYYENAMNNSMKNS